MQILKAAAPRSFWATTGGSLLKLLRPFRHKLDQWVATEFPAEKFFVLKVDCQTPMHQWDMASVARFFMDTGYLTFSSKSDWSHIRLQCPTRSIGKAVADAITDPFVSALYTFPEHKIKKIVQYFEECLSDKRPKLYK